MSKGYILGDRESAELTRLAFQHRVWSDETGALYRRAGLADARRFLELGCGPGDSSGPAFIRKGNDYFIAGISSGQSTSATGGREGVYGVTEYYTRVSTYIGWIEETISKSE